MESLKNNIAIVTGGAGGIGAAICKRLAAAGASVVITYNNNEKRAQQLMKELPDHHHAVFHTPVNDSHAIKELAAFIQDKYGKLDILINNAGITIPVAHDNLDDLTDDWIDKIFTVNVRGAFAMVRACKELLLKTGDGVVVNISSVAGVTGIGSNVAYCASKAALDSITRSLARALAPAIRVVSVSPGWVMGEYAKTVEPSFLKSQLDATPLNRFATPEDVANAVYAVATTLTFTTGCIIAVDGGRPLMKK
jgi:3-oxoacyl-[acyl-carrier protein] reductase